MEGKTPEQALITNSKKKQLQTLANETDFLPALGKIQVQQYEL